MCVFVEKHCNWLRRNKTKIMHTFTSKFVYDVMAGSVAIAHVSQDMTQLSVQKLRSVWCFFFFGKTFFIRFLSAC